ncbi:MAG: DUF5916 domain-containing protein [Cyclobacteriaceae bacterium]
MKRFIGVAPLLFFFVPILFGQNLKNNTNYFIKKALSEIVIDGYLDETDWENAQIADGFYQTFPIDSLPAQQRTEFKITYDNDKLYVAAICYKAVEDQPIVRSLRRDFNWSGNDNFSIYIDSFNDQSNGFTFQVTPLNVQREGLVTLGGGVADDWDNKWFSEAKIYDEYWIVEMAIPFKSFRYNEESNWNIQALRNNQIQNERTSFIQVPIQYSSSDLVYTAKLVWDQKPPKAGTNISLIPYVNANSSENFELNTDRDSNIQAGLDAKVGLTNSLNLDLTFNPDFSQVEVDAQVTNLDRFELFFPERRQFFLENQDLFATNGFPGSRPFFSRRIGIVNTKDGLTRQVPIIGGARLSGKIGEDWRVGALSMQTEQDPESNTPSQNYSVAVFQRQIFSRSNIGAVFVNRQSFDQDKTDTLLSTSRYNRVYGVDYNLLSEDNKWEGNFFYHRSSDPEKLNSTFAHGGFLAYRTREFRVFWFQNLIGENYSAEVGFVPRKGIYSSGIGGELSFYPEGKIQKHGPSVSFEFVNDLDFNNLDKGAELSYDFNFLNRSEFGFGTEISSVLLLDDFNPTDNDQELLFANNRYDWLRTFVYAGTDDRKMLSVNGFVSYGGFYTGKLFSTGSFVAYRLQPYLNIEMNFEYNRLDFASSSTEYYLIGPRIDLTMTNKLFWTTFLQYNNQIDNFNVNTRLQWRFKPVSDLFIVYTDNYNTLDRATKNRALVVKLSYWFNI